MENKGNPYHDKSGKFTSKEGQGSGEKEQGSGEKETSLKENLDAFGEALKRMGFNIEEKEEQSPVDNKDFLVDLNKELYNTMRIIRKFNWSDEPEDIAEGIAYELSKKYPDKDKEQLLSTSLAYVNDYLKNEDEINSWLEGGWSERMFDYTDMNLTDVQGLEDFPNGIDLTEYVDDIGGEFKSFVEENYGKMSPEEEKVFEKHGVIPFRIIDDMGYSNSEEVKEGFANFLKEKYVNQIYGSDD